VSAAAIRVYRLVLLLYPAEFRRRYGDEMVQLRSIGSATRRDARR
jgi:hypothetical protein